MDVSVRSFLLAAFCNNFLIKKTKILPVVVSRLDSPFPVVPCVVEVVEPSVAVAAFCVAAPIVVGRVEPVAPSELSPVISDVS